uniref:Uncharacterized protein n=1 Tax=Anguilla anguilla TaxID=7936 RepID=A0A0E9PF47_ANGAN
MPRDKKTGCT